jgi:NAD(P)-dependent dehydrogenase (short-subunit alcohol dehydrogenase family)
MDLKGKVCLVTGGTSGIGAATAVSLAQRGAHIATVSRKRVADNMRKQSSEAAGKGPSYHSLEADVADPAACRDCVGEVIKIFGRLDVLVHSAGGAVAGGRYMSIPSFI